MQLIVTDRTVFAPVALSATSSKSGDEESNQYRGTYVRCQVADTRWAINYAVISSHPSLTTCHVFINFRNFSGLRVTFNGIGA